MLQLRCVERVAVLVKISAIKETLCSSLER